MGEIYLQYPQILFILLNFVHPTQFLFILLNLVHPTNFLQ